QRRNGGVWRKDRLAEGCAEVGARADKRAAVQAGGADACGGRGVLQGGPRRGEQALLQAGGRRHAATRRLAGRGQGMRAEFAKRGWAAEERMVRRASDGQRSPPDACQGSPPQESLARSRPSSASTWT